MKKKSLSKRMRELETQETVTCAVGTGPPTHRGAAVQFYFDMASKRLWYCIGGANWRRVATDG